MSQTPTMKICPYLRNAEGEVANPHEPTTTHFCHATEAPFSPAAVQQSSCCLNPAIFSRCPYFAGANTVEQAGAGNNHAAKRSSSLSPLDRLLGRKKKKRIYLF